MNWEHAHQKLRRQRARLFIESGGLCFYCQIKTVFPRANGIIDGIPNLATIDHVYSRFDPIRKSPNMSNERRRVLSCFNCNQTRARIEQVIKNLCENISFLHKDGDKIKCKKAECLPKDSTQSSLDSEQLCC